MLLRKFNSGLIHEVSSVPITMLGRNYDGVDEQSLRYNPRTGMLTALMSLPGGWPHYLVVINPTSGVIVAESADPVSDFPGTNPIQTTCQINFANGNSVYLTTTTLENLAIFSVTAS